eukprot:gb/GFBE01011558.1/.p1 GENE.gb/GFBE01011558.1/~~gb/GFBE01011558.1/.p1  ORF type:complete len:427 (+),score=58.01 gb/GFBE01011558.1/:1-1281(+)
MIKYEGIGDLLCTARGSVLVVAAKFAIPLSILAGLLKHLDNDPDIPFISLRQTIDPTSFKSFGGILGFFMIFRTSQAYTRYWSGGTLIQQMSGSWFGAASLLFSFVHASKADAAANAKFRHTLIRLLSILHGMALVDLEGADYDPHNLHVRYETLNIVDGGRLDDDALFVLGKCQYKTELVGYWIQSLLVENIASGVLSIPPPILNSAFLKLAEGMVKLQDCSKITLLPFPFPYAQATLWLLMAYAIMTPVMICTVTNYVFTAAFYSFLVLMTNMSLYLVSIELEHPFGDTANDIDVDEMQDTFNDKLLVLLHNSEARSFMKGAESTDELLRGASNVRSSLSVVIEDAQARQRTAGGQPPRSPSSARDVHVAAGSATRNTSWGWKPSAASQNDAPMTSLSSVGSVSPLRAPQYQQVPLLHNGRGNV